MARAPRPAVSARRTDYVSAAPPVLSALRPTRPLSRPGSPPHAALTVARVAFDAGAAVTAALLAFLVRFDLGWFVGMEARGPTTVSTGLDFPSHLVASLVWVGALLGALALSRLYDEDTLFPGGGELARVLRSTIEAVAVLSVFVYFTHSFSVSRSWVALMAFLSAGLVGAERIALRRLLRRHRLKGRFRRPVVVVSRERDEVLEAGLAKMGEFDVVGYMEPETVSDELRSAPGQNADLVVPATDVDDAELWRIVVEAGEVGRSVFLHSSVRSVRRDRLTLREVAGRTLVKVAPPYLGGWRAVQKRTFDVVGAGLLLLFAAPFMVLIGVAVAVTSGFPILFGQERLGKESKPFQMWKFRTMSKDAERVSRAVWTNENDPRRTKLGKYLRRTSLDELPQLWNVLLGEMSLVGPRPERPVFVDRFAEEIEWYRYRHRIRPGITGWAQIHGFRGNTPLDPRTDHDNWYIENWSPLLDVKILLQTLGALVRGRNAY